MKKSKVIDIIEGDRVGACEMAQRFIGPQGRRVLVDAFRESALTRGDTGLAQALAAISEVCVVEAGGYCILQDGPETDLFLILLGEVRIICNGRSIGFRKAGQYVGELTLINPMKTCRAATVQAMEPTVLARIREPAFAELAEGKADLWRNLAIEATSRHRQRLDKVPKLNEIPRIFLGSSSESKAMLEKAHGFIARETNEVRPWMRGVFEAGDITIETLEKEVAEADFALLLLSPDDVAVVRRKRHSTPRDNVILELGLFMGALGRKRALILKAVPAVKLGAKKSSRPDPLKLPSDLLGVTTLDFDPDAPDEDENSLQSRCDAFLRIVERDGAK